MLSIHRDAEEEVVLRQERDAAEERGYPAWAADWCRANRAKREAKWGKPKSITERMAPYYALLECRAQTWNYGRIYIDANEMRIGEAVAPSYTSTQQRRDAEAESLEMG